MCWWPRSAKSARCCSDAAPCVLLAQTLPMTRALLHFRPATVADLDALIALVTSAYRGDASRIGWTTEADLLDGPRVAPEVLLHDLERPRSIVLIAECDEVPELASAPEPGALATIRRMVACAHVCDEDEAGYFGMFAVDPGKQSAGIGDAVLKECERIAADEWRLPCMRMTVIDVRDELIAWYERRGYRRTGEHRAFPYGDPRFGDPKRDDLRFEVLEKALRPGADAESDATGPERSRPA